VTNNSYLRLYVVIGTGSLRAAVARALEGLLDAPGIIGLPQKRVRSNQHRVRPHCLGHRSHHHRGGEPLGHQSQDRIRVDLDGREIAHASKNGSKRKDWAHTIGTRSRRLPGRCAVHNATPHCGTGNPALSLCIRNPSDVEPIPGRGTQPGSAGLDPKGDLRPADRYSTFPFKVADPRTSTFPPAHRARFHGQFGGRNFTDI